MRKVCENSCVEIVVVQQQLLLMLRSSLLCLRGTSTYLQPSSSSSSFVVRRQLSKESVDQKITQKLKEYKQKANFQPQKFDPLPCIDATKLVAEPPKKPKGQKKVKVHRKKLRFVKNGMDKIQPYWIPSPNSPIYSIVVETRNMFEV